MRHQNANSGSRVRTRSWRAASAFVVTLIIVNTLSGGVRRQTTVDASVPYETGQYFSAVVFASSYCPEGDVCYDPSNPDPNQQCCLKDEVSMPDGYMKFAMRGWQIPSPWSCYAEQTYFVDLYYNSGLPAPVTQLNVPVNEAGPWNVDDGYVMPEACSSNGTVRRAYNDPGSLGLNVGYGTCPASQGGHPWNDWHQLPAGLSEAAAAYNYDFNRGGGALGQDQACRNKTTLPLADQLNGAEIDLSQRVMKALTGFYNNTVNVRVVFKWQTGLATREGWNNTTRSGLPCEQQTNFYVAFDWDSVGISCATTNFAVKWTNRFNWERASTKIYCFYVVSNDETRLFIGNKPDTSRPWEVLEDGTQQWIRPSDGLQSRPVVELRVSGSDGQLRLQTGPQRDVVESAGVADGPAVGPYPQWDLSRHIQHQRAARVHGQRVLSQPVAVQRGALRDV